MIRYKLAPMDQYMLRMTKVCLLIPVFFFLTGPLLPYFLILAFLITFLYSMIWLRLRPKAFVVDGEAFTIEWPVGKQTWNRSEIVSVEFMTFEKFKKAYGLVFWTNFRMFISRIDGFVIVNFREGKPLMMTPENPESFIQNLKL